MGNGGKWVHIVSLSLLVVGSFVYSQRSEIDSINKILSEKELFSATYPKDTSYINVLNALAYQYIPVYIDSTYILANNALKMSEAVSFDYGIAKSLLHIGIYYSEKGKSDKALASYDLALQKAKMGKDLNLLFDIYNNQAVEYYLLGEFDKSLAMHLENLKQAKIQDNPKNISFTNINIAVLFSAQGENLVALSYVEQAVIAARRSNNPHTVGLTMLNLAELYVSAGETVKASKSIKEAKTHLKKYDFPYLLGQLYLSEGRLHYSLMEYQRAYSSTQQSIDLLNESNNTQINYAARYQLMADILLKQKKFKEALEYANKSYKIAKNTNDLNGITLASKTLYHYHKSMDEAKKTLAYLEEFKKHSDSLFNKQNKNGILLLNAKSDFEKKQAELEAENDKTLLSKQNKINTSLLVIVILLCTLIPLFLKHRELGSLYQKITEKSKLLELREKELIKSNNTKDKLFSIIGHDLKAPVDSLRLLLNMHKKKEVTDVEFLQFSPKLDKDVSAVFFTLTNLLNWGKSQMKGQVTQKKNIAIKPMVAEVIHFLETQGSEKQLKLTNEVEDNVEVYADRDQIDVVIRNIISNAIKFTPSRGTIKIISQDFEHQHRISIIDNGIGMDAKTSKKILDPNETYSTYGTANEKGTGLGLSLCKELVEINKGEIWVESTLGKGSTFHILLPKTKVSMEILKAV